MIEGVMCMKLYERFSDEQKELYLNNISLARKYGGKYAKSAGGSFDDLVQEASIGLMKAVEKYDPNEGEFEVYASDWLKKHIKNFLDRDKNIYIKPSTKNVINSVLKVKKKLEAKKLECAEVTLEEIAKESGHSIKKVKEYLYFESMKVSSLDTPLNGDEDKTLMDVLSVTSLLGNPEKEYEETECLEHLRDAIKLLENYEQETIFLYHGFDKEGKSRTYKEVAMLTGVTANTVSRRVKKIHDKLGAFMSEKGYPVQKAA